MIISTEHESIETLVNSINKIRKIQGRKRVFRYYKVVDLDEEYPKTEVTSTKNLWRENLQFGNYIQINQSKGFVEGVSFSLQPSK